MRVLILNYEYPPLGGGAASATKNILEQWKEREDIQVDLVTSAVGRERMEQMGTNIRMFFEDIEKTDQSLHRQSKKDLILYSRKAYKRAKQLHAEQAYDRVHAFFGIPCGVIAWRLGIPYIVSLRGSDVPFYSKDLQVLDTLLFQRLSKIVWKHAKYVVANSKGLKELAQQTAPDQIIEVIYNGVDTELFTPGTLTSTKPIQIISTNRLIPRKRIDLLIEGFAQFLRKGGEGRVRLIGDGPEKERLENMVREHKIEDYVTFAGVYERNETPSAYKDANVFVLPSENEGMSNSLLEALASGLVVIATDTGGTRELVTERNGYVIPTGSSKELTRHLLELYHAPKKRLQMQQESRLRAEQLTWKSTAEQYFHLYEV